MQTNKEIIKLAKWIKESKKTVVLTGAGMSTESGLRDFRSKDGWWKEIDPISISSIEVLNNKYDLFHEFYSMRMKEFVVTKPHSGHVILAELEKNGLLYSIATQNIDGLHLEAGSKRVYELHGSGRKVICSKCSKGHAVKDFVEGKICIVCKSKLRPDIVLFGEMLPEYELTSATEDISDAELVIVIGTSLTVFPVASLPQMTEGKKVYINRETDYTFTNAESLFDLIIEGNAKEILDEVDACLASEFIGEKI
ncbi:MAG: NAD-dependent deacylase [Clostridiales bacterium]|nr:NAD-dependent deacylase [Clostridiales bacterium]